MTLPPHGSPHHEVRRRIAGCRERLRKNRAAHHGRESERDGARAGDTGEASATAGCGDDDEAAGDEERTRRSARR